MKKILIGLGIVGAAIAGYLFYKSRKPVVVAEPAEPVALEIPTVTVPTSTAPDKSNAVVYIMGGSYKTFTKYPTGMPTTEAQARQLVANWKAIGPGRIAKYIIVSDAEVAALKKITG